MKTKFLLIVTLVAASISFGFQSTTSEEISYKCLIQLTNYGGEGAYVVLSLLNDQGEYVETLSVHGDDEDWYEDLPAWYEFYPPNKEKIDGMAGASISSGGRKVASLKVDASLINAGYKLRFETAVEDQDYHEKDLEIDLTEEVAGQRLKGNGYIRYVQLIKK
ncbi:DUF2271 domain-containing protein [Roseivirga misakiensis]|uniref:Flagellin biosynthesis protein FlgD n=1 Tax=Roseivirga misakiensis TaxID=1563681 RepID=A0A1E5SY05_9BACT|nr:DUF2271 domain-containing protein [Roseivirga misakiensis]OEK04008.1 flagellin biosynthesis protein FlgD [Roseivirga misakiensis]